MSRSVHQRPLLLLVALASFLGGCSTVPATRPAAPHVTVPERQAAPDLDAEFTALLGRMTEQDERGGWTRENCEELARQFVRLHDRLAARGGGSAAALYNASLVHQRCAQHGAAVELLTRVVEVDPGFSTAQVQLTAYAVESGEMGIEEAMSCLRRIIREREYQAPEALVRLAMLQMERRSEIADADGANDLERAQKNLRRALAVAPTYVPTFEKLARYYVARAASGSDTMLLKLADLICALGFAVDRKYAPLHNVAGIVQLRLGRADGALEYFRRARKLDPFLVDAQLNFAALSTDARRFGDAEEAFRKALQQDPGNYDACIGLAVAQRGRITESNLDAQIAAVEKTLDRCKQIDASRPEAYYNESLLLEEHKARSARSSRAGAAALKAALAALDSFRAKAKDRPEFAAPLERSQARGRRMRKLIRFMEHGFRAKRQPPNL